VTVEQQIGNPTGPGGPGGPVKTWCGPKNLPESHMAKGRGTDWLKLGPHVSPFHH
jgi:hypothetical protein